MTAGRPTIYSKELAERLCFDIASSVDSIKMLCRDRDYWPVRATFYEWLFKYPEFADMYTNAKERQVETQLEEIKDICSTNEHDYIINQDGKMVMNPNAGRRMGIICNYYMWTAERLRAKKYGSKIQIDTQIDDREKKAVKELARSLQQDDLLK